MLLLTYELKSVWIQSLCLFFCINAASTLGNPEDSARMANVYSCVALGNFPMRFTLQVNKASGWFPTKVRCLCFNPGSRLDSYQQSEASQMYACGHQRKPGSESMGRSVKPSHHQQSHPRPSSSSHQLRKAGLLLCLNTH